MKIRLEKNLKELKTIWDKNISKLSVETTLNFREDGLFMQIINPANTLATEIFMSKDSFDEYEVSEQEKINIKTADFVKFLKRFTKEVTLESKENRLVFSSGKKELKMATLTDVMKTDFPDDFSKFHSDNRVTVKTKELSEALLDNNLISPLSCFELSKDGFYITSTDKMNDIKNTLETIETTSPEETIKLFLSNELVDTMFNNTFETITLHLTQDNPVYFECNKEEEIKWIGIVAPNIEEY